MKVTDFLPESSRSDWNTLISLLDRLFGFRSRGRSKIRRVKQEFDQETGEHVIYLAYRVKAMNQPHIPKKPVKPKLTTKKGTKER